jgi:hypothetical protein
MGGPPAEEFLGTAVHASSIVSRIEAPEEAIDAAFPSAAAVKPGASPDDAIEDLFRSYVERLRAADAAPAGDVFSAIERADIESKLLALFFIRDRMKIEDYADLIRSFRDDGPMHIEVEILKAALFQRVGRTDLRDRALARISRFTVQGGGGLKMTGLSFAKEILGYRRYTPAVPAEFSPGQELLIYGELEGFVNAPAGDGSASFRRSFAAELVLRDAAGAEADRRELLRAGHAVEVVEDAAKPVHFWGRYPLPARLQPGSYRLEIEARDVEGGTRGMAQLAFTIR